MRRSVLVLLALSACVDELPEVTIEGDHVVVAADPGLEMCAGTLAHMDDFMTRLAHEFSLDPPTGDIRTLLFWLDDQGFYERSRCPPSAYACARGRYSFSPGVPVNHELVHNTGARIGDAPPFFTEGLAQAFEGLGRELVLEEFADEESEPGIHIDTRELIATRTSSELSDSYRGYETAGAFMARLADRHGLDATLDLFAALKRSSSWNQIDVAFRDVLGVSLDDSIADFEATTANCSHQAYDPKLVECAAPELEWRHGRLTEHRAIGCDQDDAVGPYGNESVIVFRTFTIAGAGDYEFKVVGDTLNYIAVVPCDGGCAAGPGLELYANTPAKTMTLAAGRYSLRLRSRTGPRTSIGLSITPVAEQP
jgi:hypothetical protein